MSSPGKSLPWSWCFRNRESKFGSRIEEPSGGKGNRQGKTIFHQVRTLYFIFINNIAEKYIKNIIFKIKRINLFFFFLISGLAGAGFGSLGGLPFNPSDPSSSGWGYHHPSTYDHLNLLTSTTTPNSPYSFTHPPPTHPSTHPSHPSQHVYGYPSTLQSTIQSSQAVANSMPPSSNNDYYVQDIRDFSPAPGLSLGGLTSLGSLTGFSPLLTEEHESHPQHEEPPHMTHHQTQHLQDPIKQEPEEGEANLVSSQMGGNVAQSIGVVGGVAMSSKETHNSPYITLPSFLS